MRKNEHQRYHWGPAAARRHDGGACGRQRGISLVLLRTKQAAELETHQGLINGPMIDQLNSVHPHDFLRT